jgi:para-aminobenzoate synthetase component 1
MRNVSKPPFGTFYRIDQQFLCCASPERFVARRNTKLITQPIKGTNRRLADTEANIQQQHLLRESQKERSENVMIVDLMRNDLAKICLPSSVLVDELFGVYAFRHVNQMISTISGKTEKPINIVTAMDALFPMGSMTGRPRLVHYNLLTGMNPLHVAYTRELWVISTLPEIGILTWLSVHLFMI